jgi:5-formyltetrahydrofolate cyclo-ligase
MNPAPDAYRKRSIRKELRARLSRLGRRLKQAKDRRIQRKILKTARFRSAAHVFSYISKAGEVNTRPIIARALALGKCVYVPRILRSGGLAAYRVRNLRLDLRRGRFGILEPVPRRTARGEAAVIELALIPGLGFDRSGRRLGRGGGYFDRFLKRLKRAETIGLAYREQILKRIPAARHDVRVDRVLTD